MTDPNAINALKPWAPGYWVHDDGTTTPPELLGLLHLHVAMVVALIVDRARRASNQ